MGMYTELVLAVELDRDTPKDVIDILEYMCGMRGGIPEVLPDHPLFKAPRWAMLLCCDSAYFAGDTNSYIKRDDFDSELKCSYYLTIRSNLKNYDYEIELFLDWLSQYVRYPLNECVGYYRYEEFKHPMLIYFTGTGVELGSIYNCGSWRYICLDNYLPKSFHDWKVRQV
jgi:hypothetical protein